MKLNFDCVRDIMLYLEDELVLDEGGDVIPLRPEQVARSEALSSYQYSEVLYCIRQLFASGALEAGVPNITQDIGDIMDITPTGHQFIKAIRDNTIWNKLRENAIQLGLAGIPKLISLAISYLPNH